MPATAAKYRSPFVSEVLRGCSVDGCDRSGRLVRGMCLMHWQRDRRTGNAGPAAPLRVRVAGACVVEGCSSDAHRRGLCQAHWKRSRRRTDDVATRYPSRPAFLRVLNRTERLDTCWIFTGGGDGKGYGSVGVGRREEGTKRTHQVVYEALRGPVPDGFELDHLCATPRCVNPDHLEPVTHAENMRRYGARRSA